jgi:ABC-type polysaccharide/polyol phosphate transport system ATPase subunit
MSTTATRPPISRQTQASRPVAVSLHGVSKSFKLPHRQYHTLKERALHPFQARTFDVLEAVKDVNLEIAQGEFFGIIGRNGSGKSTLLKCIAGIYQADAGEIMVRGRLSPFIELGVGFNMDLSARDNVTINAIMLGLSRREVRERFDAIIDFAELHEFLDLRLKNYSSGMLVRLAFSVAIQVSAEILLIDEVLAVGDANFQQKCFDEFERLKKDGRTILFVTHDMGTVERFCDRAMLLDRGDMVGIGEPAAIARRYNQLNFGRTVQQRPADDGVRTDSGYRPAEIVDAWFEDTAGNRIAELAYGEPCCVAVEVRFNETIVDPIFGVTLRNDVGMTVFSTTTTYGMRSTGEFERGHEVVARLRFDNWLANSRYSVTPSIARHGFGADAYDLREDMASLVVHGAPATGAVVQLPHAFEIEGQ